MRRALDAIREVNRTRRPEHSVVLRVAVLLAVEVSVVAVLVSGTAPVTDAVVALLLLPVGALVSWHRRSHDNLLLKLVLTVATVAVLGRFLQQVAAGGSIDDVRLPLAGLFLGVQVVHGFDLPQRRDLGFTLASSLALVTLGATGTHAGVFGLLLVVWIALTGGSLVLFQRSATAELVDDVASGEGPVGLGAAPVRGSTVGGPAEEHGPAAAGRRSAAHLGRTVGPVLLAGGLVLSLLPRADAGSLGRLPFSELPGASALASAALTTPGLPDGGATAPPDAGDAPLSFSSEAYFGFAEYVDLRTVGELPDTPVLRVRSPVARPLRGLVFDTYDGRGWQRSTTELPEPTFGLPVALPRPDLVAGRPVTDGGTPTTVGPRRSVVQTVEVLHPTPNLVFSAAEPTELWIGGRSANVWPDGTVSTSTPMEPGTVYSVEALVPTRGDAELSRLAGPVPADVRERWTVLPPTVTRRTHDLAARLTANTGSVHDAARAVERWLGENVAYSLDGPPPPPGVDQVDDFLFERRVGWCEPIASSMVVLLRSVGIPARFVTGFQPGDRNLLSGVYDVRMSDAHAWVEVWVPGEGWTSYDPTGAVPLAPGSEGSSVPAVRALAAAWERVTAVAERVGPAWTAATAGAAVLLALGGLLLVRRRRRPPPPDGPYEAARRLLADRVPVDPAATPREWVAQVRLHLPEAPGPALERLLEHEEARRYGRPDGRTDPAPWDAVDELTEARRASRQRTHEPA